MKKQMMKKSFGGCLLFLLLLTAACTSNNDFSDISGVSKATWGDTEVCSSLGGTLEYTFTAAASWMVSSNQSWCVASGSQKASSNATLVLEVEPNKTEEIRTATITVSFNNYASTSFLLKQSAASAGDTEMNIKIDAHLAKYYLWNDEYNKKTHDFSIPYVDSYDNFFVNTLMGMTTNTLDKKYDEAYGEYSLYSYISRKETNAKTRTTTSAMGVNHGVEKEGDVYSYGIVSLLPISFTDKSGNRTGEYGLAVKAVYSGSSAEAIGVKRGAIILEVDGQKLTEDNWISMYLNLLQPVQKNLNVKIYGDNATTYPLQAMDIDPTPIIKETIMEEGTHKIGYLVYDSFDAAYDDDLLAVIKKFKDAGITDLVLDLRYNGGGYVVSSNMLSSCIASAAGTSGIYQYYRFNDTRMSDVTALHKETGYVYDEAVGYFYENFYSTYFGVNLSTYKLGLNRLYVLATGSTASASEALVNALRGIDVPVTLIGEQTNGKNVGSEVLKFDLSGYSYEVSAISFQGYNAKQTSVDPKGMQPDIAVSDWSTASGFVDFGEKDEPMLAAALEQITGVKATTRSIAQGNVVNNGKPLNTKLPQIKHHPRGMIILP